MEEKVREKVLQGRKLIEEWNVCTEANDKSCVVAFPVEECSNTCQSRLDNITISQISSGKKNNKCSCVWSEVEVTLTVISFFSSLQILVYVHVLVACIGG